MTSDRHAELEHFARDELRFQSVSQRVLVHFQELIFQSHRVAIVILGNCALINGQRWVQGKDLIGVAGGERLLQFGFETGGEIDAFVIGRLEIGDIGRDGLVAEGRHVHHLFGCLVAGLNEERVDHNASVQQPLCHG